MFDKIMSNKRMSGVTLDSKFRCAGENRVGSAYVKTVLDSMSLGPDKLIKNKIDKWNAKYMRPY